MPRSHNKGQPTKSRLLNASLIKKLANAVAGGLSFELAAASVGVHRRTFYDWRKKSRAAKSGLFKALYDAIEQADAVFIQRSVAAIQAHGKLSWQAVAWILERRHPELFGKADRLQAQQLKELANELKALRGELANKAAI